MRDIRTIEFITTHYIHLQGLRLAPLGVPFLFSAAWRAGWLTWWPATRGYGADAWFIGALLIAVGASFMTRRWYEAEFGFVEMPFVDSSVAALTIFAAAFLTTIWCQLRLGFRVSLPLVFAAGALTAVGAAGAVVRPHYLIIAVLCGAFACLRPLGVPLQVCDALLDGLIGSSLIIAGVGDHLTLRRAFTLSAHARSV